MSTDVLGRWPQWREKLVFQLRMKDVPGTEIGEILAEVAAHVEETGESPEDAFGDPVAYGRSRSATIATPHHPYLGMSVGSTAAYIASGIGGFMSAGAAWAIGAGDARWGPLPAWLMLIIGLGLLFGPLMALPPDLVTDPRTGKPVFKDHKTFHRLATGLGLGSLVLIAVAGWFFTG